MKLIQLIILGMGLACQALHAQSGNSLQGQLSSSDGATLPMASVALLQARDSVLRSFTVTDAEGRFKLDALTAGQYLLQISYVGYQTYWQTIDQVPQDLGRIVMTPLAQQLETVEVKAEHSPISLLGDTLEYNTAAFKVQPGDVVEDLLKRLPGVEVESDGTVKVQGETVENVLVDGKPFFGSDTRIATQNLPADAVDKVQVFDKASDLAEFTGIEDGQDEKTINLKLKEGKKRGYFGQGDAGAGTEGRYAGKFNLNSFSPDTRLSIIGMANNINEQGFSIQDYIDFMGGIGAFFSGGGRVQIDLGGGGDNGGGLPIGSGSAPGVQASQAVGLNFSKDFSPRTELTGSYFFNRYDNELERSTSRQNLLETELFAGTESETRNSTNANHRVNMYFKHKIDSFQQLIVRADASLSDAVFDSRSQAATFSGAATPENDSRRNYQADGGSYRLHSTLMYQRRFRQVGRAFVASLSGRMGQQDRTAQLDAFNNYYRPNQSVQTDSLLQSQLFKDPSSEYSLSATYTEPLGRRRYLQFSASRQNFGNEPRTDFYDIRPDGERYNDELSNHFQRSYTYDRAGLSLLINRQKLQVTTGLALQNARLDNTLVPEAQNFQASFTQWLPSLFGEYEFDTGKRLNFDYQTSMREPSPEQLQPVVNNSDPLNIYVGNPKLRPEYIHQLNAGFFLYDQFTFTSLFVNFEGVLTAHKITETATIDSLFRRTLQPVNIDQEMYMRAGLQFSTPIRPLKIATRLRLSTTQSQSILYVNELENQVNRARYLLDIGLENRKKEKVDAVVGYRLAQNRTRWSVSESLNQDYYDQQWYAELRVTPSPRWALRTEWSYSLYSAETFGTQQAIPLWEMSLTRYVLRDNKGRIRLSVFDLLNQNDGVQRNSRYNYVEQEQYNVLGRYFLLSFGYSLSGFDKKAGGIELKVE